MADQQCQYDLGIAGMRLRILAPGELRLPDHFAPFLLSETAHDLTTKEPDYTVRIFFGTDGLLNASRDEIRRFPWKDGQDFVRIVSASDRRSIRLGVPSEMEELFRERANWALFLMMERLLLPLGRVILHASAVIHEGQAILFTAPSGGGKSTQAALWEKTLGAEIINGDKAIIDTSAAPPIAYGSPISGSSGIFRNAHAPIRAIISLHKSEENRAILLDERHAFMILYSQMVKSGDDPSFNEALIPLIARITSQIPVWELHCTPTSEAVAYLLSWLTDK